MDATTDKLTFDLMTKAPGNLLPFVRVPWTVSFLLEWWPKMTFTSVLRMRANELRPASQGPTVKLKMKQPLKGEVTLRSASSDWATFEEIVTTEVYSSVPEYVQDCRTIVDLGAHIGLTTLYFATKFPKANIVAVEPNPDSFQLLQKNVRTHSRVQTLQAAVWSEETQLEGSLEPGRFSGFEVYEDSGGTVHGVPIRQILEMAGGSVDILKVDIEGAEVELFKGDLSWLDQVRCIAIEFHGAAREITNFDALMQSHGFRVIDGKHTILATR